MSRELKGSSFDVGHGSASSVQREQHEPTAADRAAWAESVSGNLVGAYEQVLAAIDEMSAARAAGDTEAWTRHRRAADAAMASLTHYAERASEHTSDATDVAVRKKLGESQQLVAAARAALVHAPTAPRPVGPAISCEAALLAVLPPLNASGPTKHVFDAARLNVEQVIRNEMAFSDFAALKKILASPDHAIAARFRRFGRTTQTELLAILDDGKVRARARAREVATQPTGSAAPSAMTLAHQSTLTWSATEQSVVAIEPPAASTQDSKHEERSDVATTKSDGYAPAPAPKLDERDYRGPLTAAAYISWNQVHVLEEVRNHLASAALAQPHARLAWTAEGALAHAFEHALLPITGTGMDLAHRLPELLYPTDVFAIIDQHRDLDEGRPGPARDASTTRGSRTWNTIVGKALAIELEASLRRSLPRMGLRYVAQADDYYGSVFADMLVASSPLDRVVARLLCDPKVARFIPEQSKRKQGNKHAARDTDAKTAFKNGLRLVSVEWMGSRDPKLWNYVRVVDCPDATPEEVSAALFDRGDNKNHTEYAYGLIVSSPFVRIPPGWARNLAGAKEYAPDKDDDATEASSALDLADSSLAEEAARAQAGKPAAKLDMNALARTLENSEAQLRFIGHQLGDWNLAHLVGPALRRVAKQKDAMLATPTETLKAWSAVADAQAAILIDATGEIAEVLQVATGAHIDPKADEAAPFRQVVEAFGIAMGTSHLAQTASMQLAVARQKKAMLPLALHERALRENHEVAQQMATDKPKPISARDGDPSAIAQSTNRTLEADLLRLKARAAAGDMPTAAELEHAQVATSQATLENRIVMLFNRVGEFETAVSSSDQGMAKVYNVVLKPLPKPEDMGKAGGFSQDDYQALAAKLRAVQMRAAAIRNQMLRDLTPEIVPVDPTEAQAAFAIARKNAVNRAQAEFAQLASDPDLPKMFERAVELVEDARINKLVVDIALMIGISVAGGLVGSLVGGLVRGSLLAGAAADTTAFARVATAARWAGGVANVVTDAGIQAVGQSAVFGGDTGLSFGENMIASLMTLGALRPIHTLAGELGALDDQAKGLWKALSNGRTAFVHAGTFTAEMLVGAGASYVAARMTHGKPKDKEEATAWGLQGAAMAVGHFVNRRLGPLNKRLNDLGEHGIHLKKRAETQAELATKLEATGRADEAYHLLEAHTQLLKDEHALLSDPAFVKRSRLDTNQLETLRAGNSEAIADTKSQAHDVMRLRFLGLEPIASNGMVWAGTRTQIELVLADARDAVKEVGPAGENNWTTEMGGQRVTFVEVDRGPQVSAPSAAQAEIHRAMARRAIDMNAQRSEQATALVAGRAAPKVKHITIGEGVAATLSHSTQQQAAGAAPGPLRELPDAIAISDGPDWWQNIGDRDIGQPVGDWRSTGFRWQPGDFNADHANLGRASDVAYANAMTALETGMVTVRRRVTAVEEFKVGEMWPVEAKWRVQLDDGKWVYADSLSFAGGLGAPRKSGRITPQLEAQLVSAKKLTYAQQKLIPEVAEGGTIVVVGDSGTAGWAAQEAARTGRRAIILARDTSLAKVPAHVRADLQSRDVEVVPGSIASASIQGDKIVLGISPEDAGDPERYVRADGLSLAIGQISSPPQGFEQLRFRMVKRDVNGKPRVVALEAYDPATGAPTGLMVQGAAMTTDAFKKELAVDDRAEFIKALRLQANEDSVPDKSRGVEPSIYQTSINVPASNKRQP